MKRMDRVAVLAAIVAGACMLPAAQAQTRALQVWQPPPQGELDPAKRVPQQAPPAEAGGQSSNAAQPYASAQYPQAVADAGAAETIYARPEAYREEDRGGAFVGVQLGKGWVEKDADQSARQINAGYRWQAGPIALLGVEVASGELNDATHDGWRFDPVDFASIGFNGRFNFGRTSPVYGLVRAGYWAADTSVNDGDQRADVDGGYFGLGLGSDIGRHLSLSLVFTSYVYFNNLDWDPYNISRADTLMFGAEFRF